MPRVANGGERSVDKRDPAALRVLPEWIGTKEIKINARIVCDCCVYTCDHFRSYSVLLGILFPCGCPHFDLELFPHRPARAPASPCDSLPSVRLPTQSPYQPHASWRKRGRRPLSAC